MSLCLVTAVRNPQRETEWKTRLYELYSSEVYKNKDSGVLGYEAMSLSARCPTFRRKERTAFIFMDQAVQEEEQGTMFLRNVGQHTLKDSSSHPRSP